MFCSIQSRLQQAGVGFWSSDLVQPCCLSCREEKEIADGEKGEHIPREGAMDWRVLACFDLFVMGSYEEGGIAVASAAHISEACNKKLWCVDPILLSCRGENKVEYVNGDMFPKKTKSESSVVLSSVSKRKGLGFLLCFKHLQESR